MPPSKSKKNGSTSDDSDDFGIFAVAGIALAAGALIGAGLKAVYDSVTAAPEPAHQSQHALSEVLEAFNCPITQEVMSDPVSTPYGHCFERDAIERWLQTHKTCPMTKKPLTQAQLFPNYTVKAAIESALASSTSSSLPCSSSASASGAERVPRVADDAVQVTLAPEALRAGLRCLDPDTVRALCTGANWNPAMAESVFLLLDALPTSNQSVPFAVTNRGTVPLVLVAQRHRPFASSNVHDDDGRETGRLTLAPQQSARLAISSTWRLNVQLPTQDGLPKTVLLAVDEAAALDGSPSSLPMVE
ncbi:hypothetical protein CAOG_00206 [Capsaspora owczarzaki ATCC 30864]|uniref:U-box domain-containing protein n=1 Tax=Capsaspora owczarzaki (strain ATCC 30864) TaxID=595528 RepID=A0A0D2VFQ4_CAPO3|nr:hypothetical protein CAOG_00206 [Capsaspora owczarzaki ATCC 30864]KJE88567.1 hypothetical protein CAOG_000206 [Capsaspora owczarzaki ATCC 30864]|eukprot:XP_004365077.2 hypothetical protein CAOG_00206 [Capsaspora owczarzaki ATCC 30864]